MVVFPPPISLSNQPPLGIVVLLLRCQGEVTEVFFKIIFSLLIPIMRHILFNFVQLPFMSISIYVYSIKIKAHRENALHKD